MRLLPRETLRKHASLIRHLVLMEPMRLTLAALAPWVDPQGRIISSYAAPSSKSKSRLSLSFDSPCTYLLSLDIHPSIMFRKRVHEQVPKHKALTVGTDQYDIKNNDFWCLQSTDACILMIQLNPRLHSLAESWDDMSCFHRIRFTNQLIRLRHNLRNLHLSKWEVTPEELNLLMENSPKLEVLRFSGLTIKSSTDADTDKVHGHYQQVYHPLAGGSTPITPPPLTANVINFRQLKAFAITYASFQPEELYIEAPELLAVCISFSQIDPKRPVVHHHSSFNLNQQYQSHQSHGTQHSPRIYWNAPRLEKLICNRTEAHVVAASLYKTPITLKSASFADYEIESRLVADVIAAQGLQLESIRLACFTGISARDIRLILTRCPNLVTFHAPEIMIWAGDLVSVADDSHVGEGTERARKHRYEEEWACKKLEKLSLYMCLEPSDTDNDSAPQEEHPYQNHFFVGGESLPCGSIMNPAASDMGEQQRQHQQQQSQKGQKWPCQRLPYCHGQPYQQQQQQQQYPSQNSLHHSNSHEIHQQANRPASNNRVRNAFRDQLCKLTRLQYLDLSGEHVENVEQVQVGLPLTLDSGVQSLAILKSLEHVVVTGWVDDMGIREIEWMKCSWPKLNRISFLKTNSACKIRFRNLLAQVWPEIVVQDKDRKNAYCPPVYYFC
jgi:hypothetical protein